MPFGRLPRMVIAGHATLPDNGMLREPPSRLVTSNEAVFGPTVVDWKPTAMVASLPGPMVVVLGEPTKNSDAFAPEIANGGVSVVVVSALIVTVAPDTAPSG